MKYYQSKVPSHLSWISLLCEFKYLRWYSINYLYNWIIQYITFGKLKNCKVWCGERWGVIIHCESNRGPPWQHHGTQKKKKMELGATSLPLPNTRQTRVATKILQNFGIFWWENISSSGAKKETRGRKQQQIRHPNCFYKAPKSLKVPENDLEKLYQKVQKFWPPSEKQLRSATVNNNTHDKQFLFIFWMFLMH